MIRLVFVKPLTGFQTSGALSRDRTRDPLITNQVLYQLSYKGIVRSVANIPQAHLGFT